MKTDDQLACRSVSILIRDVTSGLTTTIPITIVRPPLIMIHGLWDSWQAWNNFSPLVSGAGTVDTRFSILRVNYDNPVSILSSDPPYTQAQLQNASSNSLGFQYNAPNVLGQILGWIENFNAGSNPLRIPVADTQVDIVAHSMGGDIARQLVLQPNFLDDDTFGQGSIHKLITIDTPHLGSPLANLLLSPTEEGGCAEWILARFGKFAFNFASLGPGTSGLWDGAMNDLSVSSPALSTLADQNSYPLPTVLLAAANPTFQGPSLIADVCRYFSDPLAFDLLSGTAWSSAVFGGQLNDAIVTETSQLDGLDASPGAVVFGGLDHSPGVEGFFKLGFAGPNVLDSSSQTGIPEFVEDVLNSPVMPFASSSVFHRVNP